MNGWRTLALLVLFLPFTAWGVAAPTEKIITLAPHLTEWVYSLQQQKHLVAVSAYSDYPEDAKMLPVVADYQGANIKAILQLQPDIILAWEGGNRANDLSRLEQFGFRVFRSSPQQPEDIAKELRQLAAIFDVNDDIINHIDNFEEGIRTLRLTYLTPSPLPVFYYASSTPLMTVGTNTWANALLTVCGARTIFHDSPTEYPQVSIKSVLQRQPQVLVAASHATPAMLGEFWQPHSSYLKSPLIVVDPDIMSRYTLRLLPALQTLCAQLATSL